MTEIKADKKLQEVMRRTMFNLRYIYENCEAEGPFEVVQLVNSFLGAMVHPWEALRDEDPLDLKTVTLQDARDRCWPVLEQEAGFDGTEPPSYWHMLTWTRHAFAHGNVEFENRGGQISSIRIWNRHDGKRRWGTHVSVTDMDDFLRFFQILVSGDTSKPIHDYPRIFSHAAD